MTLFPIVDQLGVLSLLGPLMCMGLWRYCCAVFRFCLRALGDPVRLCILGIGLFFSLCHMVIRWIVHVGGCDTPRMSASPKREPWWCRCAPCRWCRCARGVRHRAWARRRGSDAASRHLPTRSQTDHCGNNDTGSNTDHHTANNDTCGNFETKLSTFVHWLYTETKWVKL